VVVVVCLVPVITWQHTSTAAGRGTAPAASPARRWFAAFNPVSAKRAEACGEFIMKVLRDCVTKSFLFRLFYSFVFSIIREQLGFPFSPSDGKGTASLDTRAAWEVVARWRPGHVGFRSRSGCPRRALFAMDCDQREEAQTRRPATPAVPRRTAPSASPEAPREVRGGAREERRSGAAAVGAAGTARAAVGEPAARWPGLRAPLGRPPRAAWALRACRAARL
jgi:hypothetical protein